MSLTFFSTWLGRAFAGVVLAVAAEFGISALTEVPPSADSMGVMALVFAPCAMLIGSLLDMALKKR